MLVLLTVLYGAVVPVEKARTAEGATRTHGAFRDCETPAEIVQL